MQFSRKISLPHDQRASLYELFGDAVDRVQIVEHSWFAWLHVVAAATTRRRRIYLRGSAAQFFADPKLVLHEYFHVLGQWEPGLLTVWRYLVESFRRGYWDNRFEIEAREFADDHFLRFRALLARHRSGGKPDIQPV
ncbi:MAG: hypothetical protein R3E72_04135 [Steroidobacteraceae bacterium]